MTESRIGVTDEEAHGTPAKTRETEEIAACAIEDVKCGIPQAGRKSAQSGTERFGVSETVRKGLNPVGAKAIWVWKEFENLNASKPKPIHQHIRESGGVPQSGYERGVWHTAKPIPKHPWYYGFHAWRVKRPGTIRVQFRQVVDLGVANSELEFVIAHQMLIPKRQGLTPYAILQAKR